MRGTHGLRIACVLGIGAIATACASYRYSSGLGVKPAALPGQLVEIEIVSDGGNGCRKKNPPGSLYGSEGQTLTWRITNHCGRDISVKVHSVKEKHTVFGGKYPFTVSDIRKENIANNSSYDLTATVLRSGDVQSDERGFHVYQYKFKIQPGNDEDPEIIIEWP